MTPIFKAVHIAGLALWCAGLLALPILLGRHHPGATADDYGRLRRITHDSYTLFITPAAVVAVIAGTWLIFMRQAVVPWLYAKLAFVALLVIAHAWVGHILVKLAEDPAEHMPPKPAGPVAAVCVPMLAILVLVLVKPDLDWIAFPDWLLAPRGNQLPFEVPRW